MPEVKELLKNARETRHLYLKDVSKATGIPITTIHAWERGGSYPRGKNRDIIAAFYGLPPESLDYAQVSVNGDSTLINISQIEHERAKAEYQTKPIMLHKKHWEIALAIQKRDGDVDLNQMLARLIAAEHAAGKK